jgi:uncharacterized membrane protein YfcA
VSNTVGLVPGSAAGVFGYRRELRGQRGRVLRLAAASLTGALIGSTLLLTLPEDAFEVIVPALVLIAIVLVILQPWVNAWLAARRIRHHPHGGPWLWVSVFGCGVYGGYFPAAQGVILLALMGIFLDESLQRVNGVKNVLVGLVNSVAALLFIIVADVNWLAALLIAVGAVLGGFLGALVGRRLPVVVLRTIIVAVGLLAVGKLLFD